MGRLARHNRAFPPMESTGRSGERMGQTRTGTPPAQNKSVEAAACSRVRPHQIADRPRRISGRFTTISRRARRNLSALILSESEDCHFFRELCPFAAAVGETKRQGSFPHNSFDRCVICARWRHGIDLQIFTVRPLWAASNAASASRSAASPSRPPGIGDRPVLTAAMKAAISFA